MDELAEDAAHYQVELSSAVRQERYGDAARIKRKVQEIQAADTVAAVQRQLQDALASEQYGAAAALRDRGLVSLEGWWAGKDGPEDFQGHLLHVKAEFGRWTGRIYMARDIAAMNGWRENKLLVRPDRGSSSRGGPLGGGASAGGLGGGTVGTPMMEVFVRQQQPAQPAHGSAAVVGGSTAAAQQQQRAELVPERLVHQAVALRPPVAKAESRGGAAQGAGKAAAPAGTGASATGAGAGAGAAGTQLNAASVVRLCIRVARDGSASISVLPPKPVKSQFSSWEEEEMRATMAALAGDDLKPAAPRTSAASTATSSALDDFQRPSDDDDDDILTELTRMPATVALIGRDRFTFTVLEDGNGQGGGAGASGSEGTAASAGPAADASAAGRAAAGGLPRWAAVPIDEDDSSGDEGEVSVSAAAERLAAAGRAAARAGAGGEERPVMEVEVLQPGAADEDADIEELFSDDGEDEEGDEDGDGMLQVSIDALSTGYGRVDAVATSVTDGAEQQILIEIPVGRLIRQQQQREKEQREQAEAEQQRRASGAAASASASDAQSAAGGPARAGKDTFDRLAERVAQLQAARAGRPVPPEHLANALRTLAERLVSGELAADGSSSATAAVPSAAAVEAQAAAAAAAARLQAAASPLTSRSSSSSPSSSSATTATATPASSGARRITFSRIPTNLPRSDPFCGLYLGAFGPHGPELIQLSRTMQDGEEVVCATKVTGDPNVPAGEVSFRAKVGRRHRLDSRDVYPEDLGIVARYKGEGRVAMAGYKSPRWVDGELLVFAVGSSPATGGAELGFVWSVPGEKRFLILLNKLDLKDCEK